jgi:SnoaL-like domain
VAPKLPKPIAEYLVAVEEKNSNKLAGCFAENAVVHDEGGTYGGHDAIKAWSEETQGKYNYTMDALDASVTGDSVCLRAKVTGNFPGSPVELDYLFMLAHDKIASLKIE